MSSEVLDEKKPENEAPIDDKPEAKAEGENKAEAKEEDIESKEEKMEEEDKDKVEGKEKENESHPVDFEKVEPREETKEKDESEAEESDEDNEDDAEEKEGVDKKGGGGNSKDQGVSKKRSRELGVEKKEPVTPTTERPTRERKVVERYSAPSTGRSSASKGLSIEKGRGSQLKDIPNVAFKLAKRKPDDNLQLLHTVLFGKRAKSHSLKRNIGQFSGFVWIETEQEKQRAKVKEKLDKCVKEKLIDFCDVLNIPISKASTKKEELSAKLLDFLESPHPTTDVLLADKEQKGQKRRKKAALSRTSNSGEASPETPPKKKKRTPSVRKKQKDSAKSQEEGCEKDESSDAKEDSKEDDDAVHRESDNDDKSDDNEEPNDPLSSPESTPQKATKEGSKSKSRVKSTPVSKASSAKSIEGPTVCTEKSKLSSTKGAVDTDTSSKSQPKKKSTSKKQVDKESQKELNVKTAKNKREPAKASARDQARGKNSKKAKLEPTREELHTAIVNILKEVDFNTATLSDILRQLGTHFEVDLMHRKAEVKKLITDVINNMSDDEEENEAEEEAEGDGNKDEDDA